MVKSIKYNFGESGQPINYHLHTKFSLKQLKEWFGLDENITEDKLKKNYTWNTNILVDATGDFATDHSTMAYSVTLKKLYAGDDLSKIDEEQTNNESANATVADNRDRIGNYIEIASAVKDWVADFLKNPWGKLISTLMDFFGMIGDGFQWLANTIQTDESNKVLYSYKDLKNDEENTDNKNIYTNVGKYKKGAKVITGIDVEKDSNDNGTDDFTKKTEIPVMTGDLYNIAVGHIDFLDADFLTGSDSKRPDGTLKHEEGSAWIVLRNFAATIIHICIYVASAFLIISLIWFGIRIVRTSLDNPRARAEYKEGLERFEKSLLMLIGSIVIMALCIFGTKAFYSSIEDDNYELPIRVNVEGAYSFSTTAAGYVRYMSLTEDVDEWLQKVVCTMTYLLLALINLIVVIIMMARVFILWILSMAGPIIAAINVFRRGNEIGFGFGTWAEMYVCVSLVQVVIAFIYKLILAIIV